MNILALLQNVQGVDPKRYFVKYNIPCKKDHKSYTIAINWTKEDAVDEK